MRLVLDTNVMVAALRSRLGASFLLLDAWQQGRFIALASVPLFLEYEAVLKRQEHLSATGLNRTDIDTVLDTWASWVEAVTLHYLWRPQLTDAKDELVLETAVNGRADAIVTFNTADFLAAGARFGIAVLKPLEVLRNLRIRS